MYYWFKNAKGAILIVSPYYEGETLFSYVKNFGKSLEDDTIQKIFGQLVGTLKVLFDNFKISHRDLKPENIFIKKGSN